MKAERLARIDEIVSALKRKLKFSSDSAKTRKLERQIRKIVKNLVKDMGRLQDNKIDKEQKRLAQELKRQKRELRILAASRILTGKIAFTK